MCQATRLLLRGRGPVCAEPRLRRRTAPHPMRPRARRGAVRQPGTAADNRTARCGFSARSQWSIGFLVRAAGHTLADMNEATRMIEASGLTKRFGKTTFVRTVATLLRPGPAPLCPNRSRDPAGADVRRHRTPRQDPGE
jgi:hypothetical protein